MPHRLVSPKKKTQKPSQFNVPTSPWQKLVDTARLVHHVSYRDIAENIGADRSSVWIWIHNKNGYPHPKSFTPARATALYKYLDIDPKEAAIAYDASRHVYTTCEEPTPFATANAFDRLVDIIRSIPTVRVTKSWLLNVVLTIQKGQAVSSDQAPVIPIPPAPKAGRKRTEKQERDRVETKAERERRELLEWAQSRAEKANACPPISADAAKRPKKRKVKSEK